MGNAGMVFNLEQILYVEDKNLLSGHILVLLGQDYDAAQASALIWCTDACAGQYMPDALALMTCGARKNSKNTDLVLLGCCEVNM